jgi:hypothetical protein
MRRETKAERAAWSKHFGDAVAGPSKYGNEKAGKYDSKYEAEVAGKLAALERCGKIKDLQEQVRIVLVPGNGRLRPIIYVADFTYFDLENVKHILDAKGYKTQIYRLKKRMAALLLGVIIEEV